MDATGRLSVSPASADAAAAALLDELAEERVIVADLLWTAHDWMTAFVQTLAAASGDLTIGVRHKRETLRADLTALRAFLGGGFSLEPPTQES